MDRIRKLFSRGYSIKWVGYHSPRHVWVHMHKPNENEEIMVVYLKEDYTEDDFQRVRSSFGDFPLSNTGTIWSSSTRLDLLRLAAIVGLNVGADGKPGPNKDFIGHTGCIMAYDIESDRTNVPLTSFETLSGTILSIATYCTCGEKKVFSLIPRVSYEYVLCKGSRGTVREFLYYVQRHCPQWLVGYNNFSYDNARIMYHAPEEFDHILIRMKVGIGSARSYACYIDVQGTYNIDLLTWLDKTGRSRYTNMSLKNVAFQEGIEQKTDFDTANVTDFVKLFDYNLQDCRVTMILAQQRSILPLITNVCVSESSPVIDVDRFASGTFSCSDVASWCLQNRICMDWSPCTQPIKYEGAHVIAPILGLHENVYSCDFSSMYPTIMMSANISIENCKISRTKKLSGSIWKTATAKHFAINGLRFTFDQTSPGILPRAVKYKIDKRKQIKETDPTKGDALKLGANSLYGCTGDKNSKMYAPGCSASITSGGRWCIALAESVLVKLGYKIVYGDTDSNHIKEPVNKRKSTPSPQDSMKILNKIFDFTPFPGMSMQVEYKYNKIAYFGKKTYFGEIEERVSSSGKIIPAQVISKGMSKSRKDRIGICRTLSSHVIDQILSNKTLELKQSTIGDMVSCVVDAAMYNELLLEDVSKIVKRSGQNYYEYVAPSGKREYSECEMSTGEEVVQYSASKICSMVVNELKLILAITGIGNIATVLSMSSLIV